MKILLLIHKPQARGQEIFASLLGNQLMESGFQVLMVSIYSGNFELPFKGRQIHLNLNTSLESFSPKAWKKFADVIGSFQPQIIQANGGDTLKFVVMTRLLFVDSSKLIFNNGGVLSYYLDSIWKKQFYKFLLSKIDAAVSVSQFSFQDLSQYLPKICPQVQIPIGVEESELANDSKDYSSQIFIHIGGFSIEKNHNQLIMIFSEYLKHHPSAQLWMIGDGPLREEIETIAKGISIHAFQFLGALSDPWKLVPKKAILLLPSQIEGMPSVILEAILAKVQVIAYGVGGIPEIAKNAPSCRLVPPNNSAAFLKEMFDISSTSSNEIDQVLEYSKASILEKYALEKVSNDFSQFYKSLCE